MGLGESVEALLETYAKCLSLLRVFSSSNKDGQSYSDRQYTSSSEWERQSELGRSLQADRAKIQKAYSARLSETGSRLQKGDGQSRSALRRIVRRLTDALASILGFGSRGKDSAMPDGEPLLNYDALRALSNASCIDAIDAIDGASVRLGSRSQRSHSGRSHASERSHRSHASSGSARSTKSYVRKSPGTARASTSYPSPNGYQRNHHSSGKHRRSTGSSSGSCHERRSSSMRGGSKPSSSSQTETSQSHARHAKKTSSSSRETSGQEPSSRKSKHRASSHRSSSRSIGADSGSTIIRRPSTPQEHSKNRLGRRVSMITSSSASTKLGEIPEHKLRRRQAPAGAAVSGSTDEFWALGAPDYVIRPVYPIRPMWSTDVMQEKGKPKKRFWGMFSRS